MPTLLPDADTFDANVEGPSTLSHASSAEMRANLQKLTNRTRFLINRLWGSEAGVGLRVPVAPLMNDGGVWEFGGGGNMVWYQGSAATSGTLIFEVPQIHKGTITAILATVRGGPSHAALPAAKPELWLFRQPFALGGNVALANAADTSANVAAYEANHLIMGLVGPPHAVTPIEPARYFAMFTGEAGANSQPGLSLIDITVLVEP